MKLFRLGLLTAFITGVLIFTVSQAFATGYLTPTSLPAVTNPGTCGGGGVTYLINWGVDDESATGGHTFSAVYTNTTSGVASPVHAGAINNTSFGTWGGAGVPAGNPGDIYSVSITFTSVGTGLVQASINLTYDCTTGQQVGGGGGGGAAAAPVEAPPPTNADIFLSDVCEPFDGFSADGWMTWNTNAIERNMSWQLFVGSSIDGPWIPVEGSPPWIVGRDTMNIIAQAVGVADYHGVWMKVGESGPPVNVGSAIIGRDYRMVELCGGELPPAPAAP